MTGGETRLRRGSDERASQSQLPFDQYCFVTAEFQEPNQDLRVFHPMTLDDPTRVIYIPVWKSCEVSVYHDQEPGAQSWSRSSVVLRANMAPATVILLLAVRRNNP